MTPNIFGTDSSEVLNGTTGNDVFLGAAGADTIFGGGSFDLAAYYTSPFGIVVFLYEGRVADDGFGATDLLFDVNGIGGSNLSDLIYGSDLNNLLTALFGDDTIFGLGGDDLIRGGEGNDYIDAGQGIDTVALYGRRGDFTITPIEGGFTFTDNGTGRDGMDTILGAEFIRFADRTIAVEKLFDPLPPDDALAGAVVLQNASSGAVFAYAQGAAAQTLLGALPGGWRAFDMADLNGDGRRDLLVQDGNTGSTYFVDVAGGAPAWGVVTTSAAPFLRAVGAGDFTGDGRADVLFRQDDGFIFAADMGPGGFEGWMTVGNLGQGWRTVCVGDMNGDGRDDVVFQEIGSGTTFYRDVFNGQWGYVAGGLGTLWEARAAGDVNADGRDDVVFRNMQNGDVWFVDMMTGSGLGAAWGVAGSGLSGWEVRGMADHTGDGSEDVILQNLADGTVYVRDMEGGMATSWIAAVSAPGTGWVAI